MDRAEAPHVESEGRLHQEEPTSWITSEEQTQGEGEGHQKCGHSQPCESTGHGQPELTCVWQIRTASQGALGLEMPMFLKERVPQDRAAAQER